MPTGRIAPYNRPDRDKRRMTMDQATPDTRTPRTFKPSFNHDQYLAAIRKRSCGGIYIPDFFSEHESYELREAAIERFSSLENNWIPVSALADWENLIRFLKESESGKFNNRLFPKVLNAYLFKAGTLLVVHAMRFAISLLEGKRGILVGDDSEVVKLICGYIKNNKIRLDLGSYANPEIREFSKQFCLDGWFGVVPELKLVLQTMLNKIFDWKSIYYEQSENPRVYYHESDFIQVRRALEIIIHERLCNTDLLPFVEKMAILHREKLKELRRKKTDLGSYGDEDGNSLFFYPANQAFLDEAVRLLRQAQRYNTQNGAARRQEILDLANR